MTEEQIIIVILAVVHVFLGLAVNWLIKTVRQMKKDINHNFRQTKAEIYMLKEHRNSLSTKDFEHCIKQVINEKRV